MVHVVRDKLLKGQILDATTNYNHGCEMVSPLQRGQNTRFTLLPTTRSRKNVARPNIAKLRMVI